MNETIILGGGCFWCTEAIFDQIYGVSKAESGYCGGHVKNPSYREVCMGTTGHAEVVAVSYDPEKIGRKDLVKIHLISHDPTTLNRQGADKGTQYRSVIFYQDEADKKMMEEVIQQLQSFYEDQIVTELSPLAPFYPAEEYHQDYYINNPNQSYCQIVIQPKLAKARESFADLLKENQY